MQNCSNVEDPRQQVQELQQQQVQELQQQQVQELQQQHGVYINAESSIKTLLVVANNAARSASASVKQAIARASAARKTEGEASESAREAKLAAKIAISAEKLAAAAARRMSTAPNPFENATRAVNAKLVATLAASLAAPYTAARLPTHQVQNRGENLGVEKIKKNRAKGYNRRSITKAQYDVLIDKFAKTQKPTVKERKEIGEEIKLTPSQVYAWFANRRYNLKNAKKQDQA